MITIGLCFLYYGVALFGYQLYGWLADGEWSPYSVMVLWEVYLGRLELSWPVVGPAIEWFMNWPLSLVLILVGCGILSAIGGIRQRGRARLRRLRSKWVAEQAVSAGYQQWTIKNAVTNFQKDVLDREDKGKAKYG